MNSTWSTRTALQALVSFSVAFGANVRLRVRMGGEARVLSDKVVRPLNATTQHMLPGNITASHNLDALDSLQVFLHPTFDHKT